MSDLENRPEDTSPDVSCTAAENTEPEIEPVSIPKGIEPEEAPVPAEKKSRKGLIIGLAAAAAAAAVCGFFYVRTAGEYETKYLPGTVINDTDVSNLTPADIEERLRLEAENYSLAVSFRNGRETIKGSDFGYHYVSSGEVSEILENQNPLMWGLGYLGRTSEHTVSWETAFDEELLAGITAALPELKKENITEPANAYLKFEEDGRFTVVPEVAGTKADPAAVTRAILAAVKSRAGTIDLSLDQNVYEAPTVLSDNADLTNQCSYLNDFLSTSVTYRLPGDKTKTLDRETLKDWISCDENDFYFIDDALISENTIEYVRELAAETNEIHNTRLFNSTMHGQVEVPCDDYGIVIDEPAEADLLFSELMNHESADREPVYSQNVTSLSPDLGGTYIEVDVSGQHIYYYSEGNLVLDSDCVTGTLYDPSHRTPYGTFSIYMLEEDRVLHGTRYPDGSFEYSTPVEYWMPFYQGCGFHDAPWRGEFGGSIYLESGSHGCVNLPPDVADRLYHSIYVGLPVIVYYAD